MTNSNVLEKLKILSVAVEYAKKAGRVWDSNLYRGDMYNCPPGKDVLDFMETFHTLDGFVYGSSAEGDLFGCGPANHWMIQVGESESAPKEWTGDWERLSWPSVERFFQFGRIGMMFRNFVPFVPFEIDF